MAKKDEHDPIRAKKLAAIKSAIKQMEKTMKQEGLVQILGEHPQTQVSRFSSGSLLLDIALGGGIPRGRIIEFFGAESSGKTLCATRAAAEVQAAGGYVAVVDMEHAFDPAFASKLGLNSAETIFSQPDHLQDAFTVIDGLIDSGGVDLIILDSIASLVPKEELEGEVGKQTVGLIARYMSQFLRRISPKLANSGTTLIAINQIRDAIGVKYGDPTSTPGGRALKFYASVRIRLSQVGGSRENVKVRGEEITIGHTIRASVVKNKVAPPFRKAEFKIYYDGRPIDKVAEVAEAAILAGILPKYDSAGNPSAKGLTYLWPGEPDFKAKGRNDVTTQLRLFPAMQAELVELLTSNDIEPTTESDPDDNLTPDEFEAVLDDMEENGAEESGWEEL